ncbi:SPOR domain-containing protein [Qipengyuania thermophila]|uniref:SPOR domain-containing protein n=1 Tax=Qipengyuania thermophila TaxID=2509361 RepID=UPI0013ED1632|nr:SPOR domain-containing protein [Qipengyuania thermophila]
MVAARRAVCLLAGGVLFLAGQAAAQQGTPQDGAGESTLAAGVAAWERGDDAEAVRHWRALAEAGDAAAQFNLAQAYRLGRGVAPDRQQALRLYAAAAAQGHEQAAINHAILRYAEGEQRAAMPLLRAAAEAGDARARYLVGLAHINGDWLDLDLPRGAALLLRASEQGSGPARRALTLAMPRLDAAQQAEARRQADALRAADARRNAALAALADAEERGARADVGSVGEQAASRLQLPDPRTTRPPGSVVLQLGSFADPANARRLLERLRAEPDLGPTPPTMRMQGGLHIVQAEGFADPQSARQTCDRLRRRGFDCLVRR